MEVMEVVKKRTWPFWLDLQLVFCAIFSIFGVRTLNFRLFFWIIITNGSVTAEQKYDCNPVSFNQKIQKFWVHEVEEVKWMIPTTVVSAYQQLRLFKNVVRSTLPELWGSIMWHRNPSTLKKVCVHACTCVCAHVCVCKAFRIYLKLISLV